MSNGVRIHWFRQDLRLYDNPSLMAASRQGMVLPVYIHDPLYDHKETSSPTASELWLYHSLNALNKSMGGALQVFSGNTQDILKKLAASVPNLTGIHWNRCYDPKSISRDIQLKQALNEHPILISSHSGSLLWEPWKVLKKDGSPYKIFTPLYHQLTSRSFEIRKTIREPESITWCKHRFSQKTLADLGLLSHRSWENDLCKGWDIGEDAARNKLITFVKDDLANYSSDRDFPRKNATSRLSAHLHWGEISPHLCWHLAQEFCEPSQAEPFLRQLLWREFSYYLLYHWPDIATNNLKPQFEHFPWKSDNHLIRVWQQGKTGYPIIDAGMRELWQTGTMHNRVRMIVASFLVKNLQQHWRHGYRWFMQCLFDADIANNAASWQWVAGCGTDAAPYFRVFNPVTQAEKFDPSGEYTLQFVPELKRLPANWLHKPWLCPDSELSNAGITLGEHYPYPMVDLKLSRQAALEAYHNLRSQKST